MIARIHQDVGHYAAALKVISSVMLVALILWLVARPPKKATAERIGLTPVASEE